MMMVGLIAVTGCASAQPHLNRGTVVEKEYKLGHWERSKTCRSWKKGKSHTDSNCDQWTYAGKWHEECYQLEIQYQGKEEDVCVSRIVYNSYKVGDNWHE